MRASPATGARARAPSNQSAATWREACVFRLMSCQYQFRFGSSPIAKAVRFDDHLDPEGSSISLRDANQERHRHRASKWCCTILICTKCSAARDGALRKNVNNAQNSSPSDSWPRLTIV